MNPANVLFYIKIFLKIRKIPTSRRERCVVVTCQILKFEFRPRFVTLCIPKLLKLLTVLGRMYVFIKVGTIRIKLNDIIIMLFPEVYSHFTLISPVSVQISFSNTYYVGSIVRTIQKNLVMEMLTYIHIFEIKYDIYCSIYHSRIYLSISFCPRICSLEERSYLCPFLYP